MDNLTKDEVILLMENCFKHLVFAHSILYTLTEMTHEEEEELKQYRGGINYGE